MPTIEFTEAYRVRDHNFGTQNELRYEKGQQLVVSWPSAKHYLNRGVARIVEVEVVRKVEEVKSAKPVEPNLKSAEPIAESSQVNTPKPENFSEAVNSKAAETVKSTDSKVTVPVKAPEVAKAADAPK